MGEMALKFQQNNSEKDLYYSLEKLCQEILTGKTKIPVLPY